jgi:hypothetical protein
VTLVLVSLKELIRSNLLAWGIEVLNFKRVFFGLFFHNHFNFLVGILRVQNSIFSLLRVFSLLFGDRRLLAN